MNMNIQIKILVVSSERQFLEKRRINSKYEMEVMTENTVGCEGIWEMTRMRKNIEEDVIAVSKTNEIDVPYTDKPIKSTNGYGGIFEEDDIVEQPEDDDPDESDLNNVKDVSYTGKKNSSSTSFLISTFFFL